MLFSFCFNSIFPFLHSSFPLSFSFYTFSHPSLHLSFIHTFFSFSLNLLSPCFLPFLPSFTLLPYVLSSFFSVFHPLLFSSLLVVLSTEEEKLKVFSAHRRLQQQITSLISSNPLYILPPLFLSSSSSSSSSLCLSVDGGRLGALAAQRGLQQQLHVKLASPHSLQCNSSLLRRGKVICL